MELLLDYLNNVDEARKITFAMEIAGQEKGLEILDIGTKFVDGKLSLDDSTKPTNVFTYVISSTCCRRKNIKDAPRGNALSLRRICNTDEKLKSHANEYK